MRRWQLGPEVGIGQDKLHSIQRGLLDAFPTQLWDECRPTPVNFDMPQPQRPQP